MEKKKQKENHGNIQPDHIKYNKLSLTVVLKIFTASICYDNFYNSSYINERDVLIT